MSQFDIPWQGKVRLIAWLEDIHCVCNMSAVIHSRASHSGETVPSSVRIYGNDVFEALVRRLMVC